MHIDYSSLRNKRRDLGTEKLVGALGVETIDAVDDLRLRLRESAPYLFGQKQMLGRAGASTLAHHPVYSPITRSAVVELADGFDQLDQGCILGDKRLNLDRLLWPSEIGSVHQ